MLIRLICQLPGTGLRLQIQGLINRQAQAQYVVCRSFGSTNWTRSSQHPTKPTTSSSEEPLDPPIQYSTSKASKWLAKDTHMRPDDSPKFQPLIVCLSIAVFLLYFCILREENDVDEEMGKTLWERVPGLERKQLDVVLDYNEQIGLPTEDIKKRIKELDEK